MADSSILELQRSCHEMAERLSEATVKEALHPKKSKREQINSDYRMKILMERSLENVRELRSLYDDKDGLRKEEIAALSGPNEFAEFYNRLKSLKDFHRKHPNEICIPMCVEFDELAKSRENTEENLDLVPFTDEEGYGKYLDLHEMYNMFINLKGVERVDYLTYLSSFDCFFDIPKDRKNSAYKDYLVSLLTYLEDYLSRVKPLFDIAKQTEKVAIAFEKDWAEGTCPGWPKEASGALAHTGAHLDLSTFSSWEELASLGLDRLKSALMALGLKRGGTLEERAQRLFSCKGKDLNDINQTLLAKSKPGKAGKTRDCEALKEIAFLEAQTCGLIELLGEERAATKDNIQRKQARTVNEREESDDEVVSDNESDNEDNDVPYNPKNLPLGWDGKPIPYWLYKLHGLNISYICEICGNYTYRGPKVFQRHFAEWRHAHGMRCLGVPNTAHFANVTLIEDAIALWQKLKASKEVERWRPDTEEEFEDSSGNVVTKKTFDDLRRQGLL